MAEIQRVPRRAFLETHDLVFEVPELAMRVIEAQGSEVDSPVNPSDMLTTKRATMRL